MRSVEQEGASILLFLSACSCYPAGDLAERNQSRGDFPAGLGRRG